MCAKLSESLWEYTITETGGKTASVRILFDLMYFVIHDILLRYNVSRNIMGMIDAQAKIIEIRGICSENMIID